MRNLFKVLAATSLLVALFVIYYTIVVEKAGISFLLLDVRGLFLTFFVVVCVAVIVKKKE